MYLSFIRNTFANSEPFWNFARDGCHKHNLYRDPNTFSFKDPNYRCTRPRQAVVGFPSLALQLVKKDYRPAQ